MNKVDGEENERVHEGLGMCSKIEGMGGMVKHITLRCFGLTERIKF